jgi:KAP family P-loop domain
MATDGAAGASAPAKYKLLLDTPSKKPALGFDATARALAEIIMASDPQFAIAVFGGWGSGKTTLMQAIQRQLDPVSVISVQFMAWRYEREEHLIVPLLDTVREALVDWAAAHPSGGADAKRIAGTIGRAMRSILAGMSMTVGVPGAVNLSFDANKALVENPRKDADARVSQSFYHASFVALREAFESFTGPDGRRIVIFVDDLDRCLPESALEVLESMKLFFDLPGFVFVVGLDHVVVEHAIDSKFRRPVDGTDGPETDEARLVTGADYIQKIFQLPYRVAPVSKGLLGDFLRAVCDEAQLPDAQKAELRGAVAPHLEYLIGDEAMNPREVKRYINAYSLQRKVSPELNRDAILAWQTIGFRIEWQAVQTAFFEYGDLFADALKKEPAFQTGALASLDPELDRIPDDFLDYVANGGTGRALVEAPDLDRYIASGAAVHSTLNPRLFDAIRDVGDARRKLLAASRAESLTPDTVAEMGQSISKAQGSVSATSSGPLGARVQESITGLQAQLAAFEQRLEEPLQGAARDQLVANLDRSLLEVRERLRRLARAGDVASPTTKAS